MNTPGYNNEITRYATVKQATDYFKIGRTTLLKIANEVGAVRRVGSRKIIIDVRILEKGLENM